MKTTHITKAIALVMTVMMLLSCVPSSVLPVFALSASEQSTSIFDNVVLGKGTVTNTENYLASSESYPSTFTDLFPNVTDAAIQAMINPTFSPYEPYATTNEQHPFLPGGSANIDLSKIFYGAPATQNYPLTKWSANTSVYNIHQHKGEYAFKDLNLIDGFTWNGYAKDDRVKDTSGNNENGVVDNTVVKSRTNAQNNTSYSLQVLGSKDGQAAYAYNRFDAMQGKYGITLDKNVSWVRWEPSWYGDYYETEDYSIGGSSLYGSVLYLSDTPYLYFSTEALDSTKISISILIGTQIQKETDNPDNDADQTITEGTGVYEYRWYTITDSANRPGIGTDTLDYSMVPNVTISDVIFTNNARAGTALAGDQQFDDIGYYLTLGNNADPLALAGAEKAETMYVDGSITGCIDFTNLLPAIMGMDPDQDGSDQGRYDIQYKIAQIRVDTKTAENAEDSAARINYLYFGPSLSTSFAPQNVVGNDRDAQSWQYEQTTADTIGDRETASSTKATDASDERAYTNGWENGQAVTIKNTPNEPQIITVDTYGQSGGELIDWANKPADCTIKQGSNDSKIWKFTDKNGNVQYMEAERNSVEHSGVDDSYYVMVTIPVRKWINVLGDSRKISLTATLLHEGTQFSDASLKPTFVLWGNENGSLGSGHGGSKYGTRFRHEDLIMVFATDGQTYHCDQGQDYVAAQVDRTIGDSLIYNEPGTENPVESWFDILQSPYTYQETVKNAASGQKVSSALVGYTFVTALRFAMPVGSAIQIQNMKGDNNSAGLNMYSATGSIVSAYDGGTGEQPNINITNSLPEKTVTITKTGTGSTASDFTYTQSTLGNGTINGSIESSAAAYGPMLETSYYTIYDLLDTEMIRSSGLESHYASNDGKEKQPVYGEVWRTIDSDDVGTDADDLPIHFMPDDTSVKYGYVYGGNQFVVYGTVKISNDSNTKWGLVGVLTKNGATEAGWVKLWDGSTDVAFAKSISGVIHPENLDLVKTQAEANTGSFRNGMIARMRNDWVISDFASIDDGADFRDGDNVNFEYTTDFISDSLNSAYNSYFQRDDIKYDPGQNMVSQPYGGPQMKYANKWTGTQGHYSCGYSLQDTYFRSVNGTDLEWGFVRKAQSSEYNLSMAMTRVFDNPIRLKQGKSHIHQSYPVLYLDYTSDFEFKIGISVRVDGEDKIWTVNGTEWMGPGESNSVSAGNQFVYLSFEDMMTKDYPNAETIEVTGLSLRMWHNKSTNSGNAVLRRCEIWQEETDWLDEIVADNQYKGGDTSTAMNCQVKDAVNIISDAFFSVHSETADGEIEVTKKGDYASGTNIGVNNASKGYEFTYADGTETTAMDYWENNVHYQYNRTESYRKNNSNKGWKAYLRLDTTKDGNVNDKDTTYYSYDDNGNRRYEVSGVYQYRTALNHLRVWVPSQTQASLVFESDRSFNVQNYKYLYYSYSMRDAEAGISSEQPDTERTDKLKPGIAVSIKENQLGSSRAYSEIVTEDGARTWAYYDTDNPYWAEDGRDNRTFKTTINAAVDLSSLDGIESVNQFVFYLNNPLGTLGDGKSSEFYINYLYLSNVAPEQLISDKINETTYQYYYMMDNTGTRYSARFPTIDNPTGQVTGYNCDNDRVNPIKVERGKLLATGTYFNGDPIASYGNAPANTEFDQSTGSEGYYERNYGGTDAAKNILFYLGAGNSDDIDDYYEYKDRGRIYTVTNADGTLDTVPVLPDGTADEFDMLWSFGRWHTDDGEAGLNILYIGDPDIADEYKDANYNANALSGGLSRRYATENYVLLRAGITPKMYTTTFDANGGEFIYESSPDYIENLEQVTENNYYITNDYILSYYNHPASRPAMKGDNEIEKCLKKPGFVFSHWEHYTDYGHVNNSFNKQLAGQEEGSHFKAYIRKETTYNDYFKAVWVPDTATAVVRTATFLDTKNATFKTVNVGSGYDKCETADGLNPDYKYGRYVLEFPNNTVLYSGHEKVHIYGWKAQDDTSLNPRVYSPGERIYLFESTTFVPVLDGDAANTFDITLVGAKLYVKTTTTDSTGANIFRPAEFFNIKCTNVNNEYVYSNVPENYSLKAVPVTAATDYGWVLVSDSNSQKINVVDGNVSLISDNQNEYCFTAHENVEISYSSIKELKNNAFYTANTGIYVTVSPRLVSTGDKSTAYFTSQFSFDGVNVKYEDILAAGTLFSKPTYYDKFTNVEDTFRLDETTLTSVDAVTNRTYATKNSGVRYGQATTFSSNYEYTAYFAQSKEGATKYYTRAYVIYKDGSDIKVAYSDVVAWDIATYTVTTAA